MIELVIMLVVISWGIIVTIAIVIIETSNWRKINKQNERILKLENCKHGKARRETRQGETGQPDTSETGRTGETS